MLIGIYGGEIMVNVLPGNQGEYSHPIANFSMKIFLKLQNYVLNWTKFSELSLSKVKRLKRDLKKKMKIVMKSLKSNTCEMIILQRFRSSHPDMFYKILQNSQENTSVGLSFLIKLQV